MRSAGDVEHRGPVKLQLPAFKRRTRPVPAFVPQSDAVTSLAGAAEGTSPVCNALHESDQTAEEEGHSDAGRCIDVMCIVATLCNQLLPSTQVTGTVIIFCI